MDSSILAAILTPLVIMVVFVITYLTSKEK
jgi:hypothetical protein